MIDHASGRESEGGVVKWSVCLRRCAKTGKAGDSFPFVSHSIASALNHASISSAEAAAAAAAAAALCFVHTLVADRAGQA